MWTMQQNLAFWSWRTNSKLANFRKCIKETENLHRHKGEQHTSRPAHLKSPLPVSGGAHWPSHHCHGDVARHLHLPGLFRRLLVGLGPRRHALLFLQLSAAQAEAPPWGEAQGAMSAKRRNGAAQLSTLRIPASPSTSAPTTTSTAAQGAASVLPPANPVPATSSTGSSSHAASNLGQHAR